VYPSLVRYMPSNRVMFGSSSTTRIVRAMPSYFLHPFNIVC